MKNAIITGAMAATILIAGCTRGNHASSGPATRATASAAPVLQPALQSWQQGDKAAAVSHFLAVDWSRRPLFASGSVLNLTEDQFKGLSDSERQAKSRDMTAQLALLKQLAAAVAQAGLDARSKGDAAQAGKDFTSLKQFGQALESSNYMLIVQLVGKGIEKRGDAELKNIGR